MNTRTPCLPRSAYSADEPVSPEVAPRTLSWRSPRQRVFEEMPEQLQRDVLERERRTVGDAQQEQSGLERLQRSDLVAAEHCLGIGAVDDRSQVAGRDVVRVTREDREGQFAIVEWAQPRELGGGEPWVGFWHDEPAVRREPFEQDRRERLRRHRAPGA
jgi:hypothetical protein